LDKSYKYAALPALVTGLLLLIPLIAMQFTDEMVWTLSDFIVAGALLFGTGLTYKLVTRRSAELSYRLAVGFALATALFLIWMNLAVGIIGAEDNPINLLYFGVLAFGGAGTLISRFRSGRMVSTMLAMALAQSVVTAIALIGGFYQSPPSTVAEIISINGFFVVLFVVSALLFRHSARELHSF